MTPVRSEDPVGEARRLLAAATRGEWQADGPWWDNHGNSLPMVTAGLAREAVAVSPTEATNPDGDLDLIAAAPRLLATLCEEVERLRVALDAAQLRSIEARNPGIDMDEVRRFRAGGHL